MLGTCRGSQVAIKQIDLAKTDQEELLAEIRILSAERQANIVMLMGVCEYIADEVCIAFSALVLITSKATTCPSTVNPD